jgi:DNA invertase Pin-like site-specific DNA recombinase
MEPKRHSRVCIYYRVSTKDQDHERQIIENRQYCEMKQWVVAQEFKDVESGSTTSREELDKMMGLLRKGRFDCLLVHHFDRFARSAIHAILTLHELETLGIDFVSVSQGIDTTTIIGRAMYQISAAFAELELKTITERVRSGVKKAQSKGVLFGRAGWKNRPGSISEEQRQQILALAGTLSVRDIARRVPGVSKSTVQNVLSSKPAQNVGLSLVGTAVGI